MRDWIVVMRPAQFRGVSFYVDEESLPKFGRRIVVHEYVKAEEHGTEDMGRLPKEFRVRAYIANDRADTDCQALVAACEAKGAASLTLPFFGASQVRFKTGSGSWKHSKLGYVDIDLEFVLAAQDGGGFPAIALGDRIAASLLSALPGLVNQALSRFPLPRITLR